MRIMGIDEAGRGPVIGPMVICGYVLDEKKIKKLEELGVKDSKLLSRHQREKMFEALKKLSDDHIIIKIPASKLNELMKEKNLNKIEIETMAKIINSAKPDRVIIDSPEVNTDKFVQKIRRHVKTDVDIVAENYADKKYPIVSAASVMAKVVRDREIEKIEKDMGMTIGSGYPGDEKTLKALDTMIRKGLTKHVRKKWITYKRIRENYSQTTLKRFGKNGRHEEG